MFYSANDGDDCSQDGRVSYDLTCGYIATLSCRSPCIKFVIREIVPFGDSATIPDCELRFVLDTGLHLQEQETTTVWRFGQNPRAKYFAI